MVFEIQISRKNFKFLKWLNEAYPWNQKSLRMLQKLYVKLVIISRKHFSNSNDVF